MCSNIAFWQYNLQYNTSQQITDSPEWTLPLMKLLPSSCCTQHHGTLQSEYCQRWIASGFELYVNLKLDLVFPVMQDQTQRRT